jgi:DNA-binding MarR family transcriptional regulator
MPLHPDKTLRDRIPPDAIPTPLPIALDSENFTPRLLHLLSNNLVWRESSAMRLSFGLGTNDWRVISALGARPGMTASDISEFVAMNKAIVSRSVNVLTDRRLIVQMQRPGRSRPLYLTAAGVQMHDAMLPISMRGQEMILSELSPEDVNGLNQLLRRLLLRARELEANDPLGPLTDAETA